MCHVNGAQAQYRQQVVVIYRITCVVETGCHGDRLPGGRDSFLLQEIGVHIRTMYPHFVDFTFQAILSFTQPYARHAMETHLSLFFCPVNTSKSLAIFGIRSVCVDPELNDDFFL